MSVQPAVDSQVALDIQPLTGALGCAIFGVDLANIDESTFTTIHQAFLDYSVVVFRDQDPAVRGVRPPAADAAGRPWREEPERRRSQSGGEVQGTGTVAGHERGTTAQGGE